ncbi:protein FAM124A-like [Argonauta hians]
MNTYILRTYGRRLPGMKSKVTNYPLWDYRSQRYRNQSSGSDGASLNSSKENSVRSESISGESSVMTCDVPESHLPFQVRIFTDVTEIEILQSLYQPLLNFLDSDIDIIKVSDQRNSYSSQLDLPPNPDSLHNIFVPSLSILIFLLEDESQKQQRFSEAQFYFQLKPWKFYHRSRIDKRKAIEFFSDNLQEFYGTGKGYPLWGIRRVHYGKEQLRFMLFVSYQNWFPMLDFYKTLLNSVPDFEKEDFCMFTVDSQINYKVQFVLKQLPPYIMPEPLDFVEMEFLMSDTTPQFPNVCRSINNNKWCTFDHDGNSLVLNLNKQQHTTNNLVEENTSKYSPNKIFFV